MKNALIPLKKIRERIFGGGGGGENPLKAAKRRHPGGKDP